MIPTHITFLITFSQSQGWNIPMKKERWERSDCCILTVKNNHGWAVSNSWTLLEQSCCLACTLFRGYSPCGGPKADSRSVQSFFFFPVGRITNELPSSTAEQQRSASFFSDIKKCLAGVWITGLTGFCFHYSSSKFASRGIISILFLGVIQFYFRKHKLSLLLTYILINCVFMSTYRAWFTS